MFAALFGVVGLVFGSFITVVVHRVPRQQSIVAPRSRCPRCGTEIRARDNVPVVSYLLLRGRCRVCGEPISAEYPLTEAAAGALFVGAALVLEPDQGAYAAVLVAPFLGIMLAVALIDARWRVVPNRIMYPALTIYAVAVVAGDLLGGGVDAPRAFLGLAAYGVPLLGMALAIPGGMGMGDVKLAALIGLVLGSLSLSHVAVAAGAGILLGGIGAIVGMVVLKMGRKQQIPFGPFLAAGAVVGALAGGPISSAYLSALR